MYFYTAAIAALAATTVNAAPAIRRACVSGDPNVALLECGPGVVDSPDKRLMPLERVCPEGQVLSATGDCETLPPTERALGCPPGTIMLEGGVCSRLPTERSMPIETVCPLGQAQSASGACEPLPIEERAVACPPGTTRLEGGGCTRTSTEAIAKRRICPLDMTVGEDGVCGPLTEPIDKRLMPIETVCPLGQIQTTSGACEPLPVEERANAIGCPPGTIMLEGGMCSRLPTTETKRLMPIELDCPEGEVQGASGACEPIAQAKRMMCPMDMTVGSSGQCEPLSVVPISERSGSLEFKCPPGTFLTEGGECKAPGLGPN